MRDHLGRADASGLAKRSVIFLTRQSAVAKTFVFPHIFAEIMELYSRTWSVPKLISRDCDTGICERTHNPYAQMKVELTLEQQQLLPDQTGISSMACP